MMLDEAKNLKNVFISNRNEIAKGRSEREKKSSKRNYKKSVQQYNEFNKIIKQNRYYIYEFWE